MVHLVGNDPTSPAFQASANPFQLQVDIKWREEARGIEPLPATNA